MDESVLEGRRGQLRQHVSVDVLLAVSTDGAVLRPGMGSVAKWLGSLGVIRGHSETGSRKSSAAAPLRRGSSLRDSIPNHQQYETVQCRAHSCLKLQSYTHPQQQSTTASNAGAIHVSWQHSLARLFLPLATPRTAYASQASMSPVKCLKKDRSPIRPTIYSPPDRSPRRSGIL